MSQDYKRAYTSMYLLNYHFVWIPRRRRPVLVGRVAERLKELILEKAGELKLEVLELAIQPDHVHLFVSAPPNLAPNQIMFRIKGYTARVLRREFPWLRKLPSMWTRAYFVSTAGNVSSETIRRYIEAQSTSA
ncbi:IS200/IS605 family transposase [Thermosulfurimonas sp. F29]|uniref:IS200/IS605 family transposase n=1 Tax=Thermosulfurimonas sp. F29 TaxID=2867247 RepID=UPI001C838AD0|nr:IS200/IS605 family transposase [Thermosulfurimonas sp. F29]MBX6423430.1 IS200/IS605 family transposase [Thermosulfurimonas sp. F29]